MTRHRTQTVRNTLKLTRSAVRLPIAGLLLVAALVGCESGVPGPGLPGGPGLPEKGVVVVTGIPIQRDGLVSIGTNIVAFGMPEGGVAYYRPGDAAATAIPGDFRGDAVYCCGEKVILVSAGPVHQVSVFDTASGTLTDVPDTDVWEIAPGARMENDAIAASGNLVAILHRGPAGKQLKLINVSGAAPVVTAYEHVLNNAISVDVSDPDNAVVVMEDNRFLTIFAADTPANAVPIRVDVTTDVGVVIASAPKPRAGGDIVLFEESGTSIVHALRLSNGTIEALEVKPAASTGTTRLEPGPARFGYFLNRNATDTDAFEGSRVALAATNSLQSHSVGTGANIGGGGKSGFGHSLALTDSAYRMYLAGRIGQSPAGEVYEPSHLQSSTGGGFFLLKDADDNAVRAADVVASGTMAAFKVVAGSDGIRLGYYIPEED